MICIRTQSRDETVALGKSFAASLSPGDVVGLVGGLGSGKTQFVIGVCEGLGVEHHVASPTFTLINEYPAPFGAVVHIDLYRIATRSELAELGMDEYFAPRNICLIEWAERVLDLLPAAHRIVRIGYGQSEGERVFSFEEAGVTTGHLAGAGS